MVKDDKIADDITAIKKADIHDELKNLIAELNFFSDGMSNAASRLVELTESFIVEIAQSEGKPSMQSRHQYVDLIEAAESYTINVINYRSTLNDDLFEFHSDSSVALINRYQHQLVVQVAKDIRQANKQLEILSHHRELYDKQDFLLERWHAELKRFIALSL